MIGGHGHVVPRPDGAKARCGGPALCSVCQAEQAAQQRPARPEFTAEQIEQGIAWAIRDREFEHVPNLLRMLAVKAPDRAQAIYDLIVHGQVRITVDLHTGHVTAGPPPGPPPAARPPG